MCADIIKKTIIFFKQELPYNTSQKQVTHTRTLTHTQKQKTFVTKNLGSTHTCTTHLAVWPSHCTTSGLFISSSLICRQQCTLQTQYLNKVSIKVLAFSSYKIKVQQKKNNCSTCEMPINALKPFYSTIL